jgi:transcription elongation GreA/GreB family factor
MSQQISEAFHQTMRISESLIAFDDSLSEEGELGQKLKKALTRADRDKAALGALKQLLSEINNRAAKMINESAQHLIAIGKHVKMLIEDYEKKNHSLILNWREIDMAAENKAKERMLDIYKKIYYFVQLLQIYLKK